MTPDFELPEGTPLKAMIGTQTVDGRVLEHERRVGFNSPPDRIRLDVAGGGVVTISADQVVSI